MWVRLTVSYDGTDYAGFQRQIGQPTVQAALEEACEAVMGPGRVIGASRTDAGVHAEAQGIVWTGACRVPLAALGGVLNRRLPGAIRVRDAVWVPAGWDPRRMARAKQYRYQIWRGPGECPPRWGRFAYDFRRGVSWPMLEEAARAFEGVHDFHAFRSAGSSARTTVRHILSSRWERDAREPVWTYRVAGTGFLYHMVRIMVAAMLDAAETGSLTAILQGLAGDSRTAAEKLAPACGLTLEKIWWKGDGGADVS